MFIYFTASNPFLLSYYYSFGCSNLASNRNVDPIELKQFYPWMAFLVIQEWKEPKKQEDTRAGTFTTNSYFEIPVN